jgi:formylglycine-generating enzyme required for sulfatase activity
MNSKLIRFSLLLTLVCSINLYTQKGLIKLPDTGQTGNFTQTFGEDSDYMINSPSFTDNGDGTITDINTGLVWQKTDGGEMTFENALSYCKSLTLSGKNDWRLPTAFELFTINHYNYLNPTINTLIFSKSAAEYWWTSDLRMDDNTKVWAVNAGGGIGAHPKNETISTGGSKKFHVRAVRPNNQISIPETRFTKNSDGTVFDIFTGLYWQQVISNTQYTWEEALAYAKASQLGGKNDWRIPNIKEIQSLNNVKLSKPSFDKSIFTMINGNYWSSTTIQNNPNLAWDINTDFGIVSYNDKTKKEYLILVRGGIDQAITTANNDILIPGDEFEMGDHIGFVDPKHPSDEFPLHKVKLDSFFMSKYEITNKEYLDFLNSSYKAGEIEVRNNNIYAKGGNDIYCFTNKVASYYSIDFTGSEFKIVDFRANHPMVGVLWFGTAAYCNWLSRQSFLQECYNIKTWVCDFTKNGYRLPTEAEWEFAARGGHKNPYFNYEWGNDQTKNKANWPESKDPYEGTLEADFPFTTPVGFYDGKLKLKSDYNWPSSMINYQTGDGSNSYGLFDMAGNVWEFVNDWYGQKYYEESPYLNPKGPDSSFKMPDGKAYRGMRGGNWYNGYKLTTDTVNDGHSRVSNRNPSYYRGPQDPVHPYYHLGFRIARNNSNIKTDVIEQNTFGIEIFPNPANEFFNLTFENSKLISIEIINIYGERILHSENILTNKITYRTELFHSGIYFINFNYADKTVTKKLLIYK